MKTKLFIFFIVAIVGALVFSVMQLRAENAELLREADRFNVPVLDKALFALSDWNYQTLKPHLSKKFLKTFTEEEFQKELDELSILGKVKSIRIRRHANHSKYKHWLYGKCAVNKYSVSTNFAKGRGVVIFNLKHCYKTAEVTFLQVHSKVLPVKSPALQ